MQLVYGFSTEKGGGLAKRSFVNHILEEINLKLHDINLVGSDSTCISNDKSPCPCSAITLTNS